MLESYRFALINFGYLRCQQTKDDSCKGDSTIQSV